MVSSSLFEKNHRSTKSDYKLFSKCVCDLYYASIPSVSIISPYDFHIFSQSISICFVHFVHIPLRSWKWQKSVKFIKIKAPREVWGLGINEKLAGGQDLPNYSID